MEALSPRSEHPLERPVLSESVASGASYPLHTVVTLTAAPDPNSTFAGWGGSCTGTGTCQVTLSTARFVVATFTKLPDTVALRYYHADPVGSVRAITDEVGAVVERHDYWPFGADVAPLPATRTALRANNSTPRRRWSTSERLASERRGALEPPRAPSSGSPQGRSPSDQVRRPVLPADVGTLHAGGPAARRRGNDRSAAVEPVRVCPE